MQKHETERILKLAHIIKWHRQKSKMTQEELASLAEMSRTALQRLEKVQTTIQLDTLFKVLGILNLSLELTGPLMGLYHKEYPHASS